MIPHSLSSPSPALASLRRHSPPPAPTSYVVDHSHTSVIFGVSHLGFSFTYGRFNKVSGKFTLDPAKPEASSFTLTIDADSIDTNDAKRDNHLKAADFFNAGEFPVISFKSTKVVRQEGRRDRRLRRHRRPDDARRHQAGHAQPRRSSAKAPAPAGQDYRTGFNCQTPSSSAASAA